MSQKILKNMNPKILVVDDIEDNLEQIVKFLKLNNFNQVNTAQSFQEAKKKVAGEHFDVIISDMIMEKEESGLMMLKEHKGMSILFIIITAYPKQQLLKVCMRLGAYDFINKNDKEKDPYQQIVDSIQEALPLLKEKNFQVSRDSDYMGDHYNELVKEYSGQYVAILDDLVVGANEDYDRLEKEMKEKYPYVEPYILGIPDQEISRV